MSIETTVNNKYYDVFPITKLMINRDTLFVFQRRNKIVCEKQ